MSECPALNYAVNPEKCRAGLATQLVQKSFEHCQKIGLDKVKVLVAAHNEPANKLYLKCGFKLVGQIDNHRVTSNIYEAQTNKALSENINSNELSKRYLVSNPGEKTHPPTPTPEPATIMLFGIGGLMTLIRKRRSA